MTGEELLDILIENSNKEVFIEDEEGNVCAIMEAKTDEEGNILLSPFYE
jgi:hypothetical protein